jgi:hypothetical protein
MKRSLVLLIILLAGTVQAAPPGALDPNWPCQSVKMSDLSIASMWTGPPVDPHASQSPDIAKLAGQLAQRRVPIEQAQQQIADFAKQAGAQKQAKLVALFAGLFSVLDQERHSVIEGLDRYGERQKQLAANLRDETAKLRTMQAAPNPDQAAIEKLADQIGWDTQIFQQRRQSLSFACDVPNVIEHRLYALAQAIQAQLD